MKNVLIIYWSHDGRTARIWADWFRLVWTIGAIVVSAAVASLLVKAFVDIFGVARCRLEEQLSNMPEAEREGVDLDSYDIILLGCAIRYGEFNKQFVNFVNKNKAKLDAKPNSMFNITAIARNPEKATVAGNVYARKFMENNPWKPHEMKCFAGKVDYPNCGPVDGFLIRLIMMMTKGPTDKHSVNDFTNWDDVEAYARHCLTLA